MSDIGDYLALYKSEEGRIGQEKLSHSAAVTGASTELSGSSGTGMPLQVVAN